MRAIELLGEESARARFFAVSRRLPLEMLRRNFDVGPELVRQAEDAARVAVIPDAEGVLHAMAGYLAWMVGDREGAYVEAVGYENYALEHGATVVRAESTVMWLGADRLDKVQETVSLFQGQTLASLPRNADWLLTMQCVLEGAVAVGNREVVAEVVTLLALYGGRSVVNAGAVMWHGVTDDTLARGFALLGDAEARRGTRPRPWRPTTGSAPPGGAIV